MDNGDLADLIIHEMGEQLMATCVFMAAAEGACGYRVDDRLALADFDWIPLEGVP